MSTKNTLVVSLVLCSSMILPMAANAQVKHRKAKAAAAGIAAYELAKHTGRRGHKNFMQRHPVLTGLGAAAMANHAMKKKHH
jgi:hypothetical protein